MMGEARLPASMAFDSASALVAKIRGRRIGCRELLELYLTRLATFGAEVNAIVVTDIEGARLEADRADRALERGEWLGPLHGLPMTIKESFHLRGTPTTFGYPAFR